MAIDNEKLVKFYLKRSKFLNNTFNNCKFKLKYDYSSTKTLDRIYSLLDFHNNNKKQLIDFEVDQPFHEYFFDVINDFNNKKLFDLMSIYFFKTEILKDKDKTIEDCYSVIHPEKDNDFKYLISMPDQEKDTAMLYASYAHELIHFPQLLRRKNYEFMEYSEVLSMFFEYLMYEKMSNGKGKEIFINNRIVQLNDNRNDLETDLYYAKNNDILGLPRETYSIILADYLSYYDGLEFVLNLIDYDDVNDKKKISDLLSRVLFDKSSMKNESENLEIETSGYSKILKLI